MALQRYRMKIAVFFNRFGPYHVARLKAAANYCDVVPIEISGENREYQWEKIETGVLGNTITLFRDESKIGSSVLMKSIEDNLNNVRPNAVAINGWYDRSALAVLYWCLKTGTPVVVMSESSEADDKRIWWKEILKKRIVQQFDAALVGGIRHANYLKKLGLKNDQIFFGYDVVDNRYFEKEASRARDQSKLWRQKKTLPENYFLIVSRFIKKKNLPFVICAYKDYFNKARENAWHLYILGDGPLKEELLQMVIEMNLNDMVHFEGFKQYHELPIYYGLANAFVHVSTVEQWGLVVNEAMASGLPVIISDACGCVPELVHDNINGYIIDPYNREGLSEIFFSVSSSPNETCKMGEKSKKIIASFDSDAFGKGLFEAIGKATKSNRKKSGWITKFIIKGLINR
jgi:glycosyltransferase involved in cell wall biosynthesis